MALIAKDGGGGGYDPVGEGLHPATCVSLVDLGNQYSKMYEKMQHKIMLTFEVHDENITIDGEEKPRVISKEYSLSLNEKSSLRKDLESWRGKRFTDAELDGFDVKNVLGKPCQIQVLHSEKSQKTYANIASIVSWLRGAEPLGVKSELLYYEIHDETAFNKLPEWIQNKIKESETYQKKVNGMEDGFIPDDDEIPEFMR